jgi:hypothetical protein
MLGEILRAGVPSLLGIAAFLLAARLLHIDELDQLWRALRRKLLGR